MTECSLIACGYPKTFEGLAEQLKQPDFPRVVSQFLRTQENPDVNPHDNLSDDYTGLRHPRVSVFDSAVATYSSGKRRLLCRTFRA